MRRLTVRSRRAGVSARQLLLPLPDAAMGMAGAPRMEIAVLLLLLPVSKLGIIGGLDGKSKAPSTNMPLISEAILTRRPYRREGMGVMGASAAAEVMLDPTESILSRLRRLSLLF